MSLQPYAIIFPDTEEPTLTLQLDRKTGAIPKGAYSFFELYCIDPECDCRRVTLIAVNEKMKEKAVISMGFDPEEPMAGPYLDDFHKQSAYADMLLDFFVDLVNDDPDILEMLHRHYREVRAKVTGKKYRGKAFPKAGRYYREATPAPDMAETLMDIINDADFGGSARGKKCKASSASESIDGMRFFAERYHEAGRRKDHGALYTLQDELRRYILDHDTFATEIATLLVELCSASPDDDGMIDAALRVLSDSLEILRVELERKRPDSGKRMERLQKTLAQKIFVENGAANLCAAVSHVLLQSRVEILPVIHDATNQRMLLDAHNSKLHDMPEEGMIDGLFKSIEEMGGNSPFETVEQLLQILALGPAEMQIALCGEMLAAQSLLIRDAALLMILHPLSEVRTGVAELLAKHGKSITPESLRRLIISRNWFPETLRKSIDKAVTAARKGRVECAPLPKSLVATVYASPVDGAFAQSFQVIVPDGKGFSSCAVLLKKGAGVADAFVVPLRTKQDKKDFMASMNREGAFIESSMEYLDQRVCHGLAEGAALDKAPNHWLLQVAETLGRDQWKAMPFDPQRELEQMRATLAFGTSGLQADNSRKKALQDSVDWCEELSFTFSWFEDDADVDKVIADVMKKNRKGNGEWPAVHAIIDNILEKRRGIWLERLILCTLWLKSSPKPPLPWHQMFYLAEAVADQSIPLTEIPLMESVAVQSLGAYLERLKDEGR